MTIDRPDSAPLSERRAGSERRDRSERRSGFDPRGGPRGPNSRILLFAGSGLSLAAALFALIAWHQPAADEQETAEPTVQAEEAPSAPAPLRTASVPAAAAPQAPTIDAAKPPASAAPPPAAAAPTPPPPSTAVVVAPPAMRVGSPPTPPKTQVVAAPAVKPPPVPVVAPVKPAPPPPAASQAPVRGGIAQIGAYPSRADAEAALAKVAGKAGAALQGKGRRVEEVAIRGTTLYRAQFTGFASSADAAGGCKAVKATGADCLAKMNP